MVPSAGNTIAYPKAIMEAKKKIAIPNSGWLIAQLSIKRPKKDDPARKAYDAVVKLAQQAISGLKRVTASQCALMLGISDSAWRHAASKASASQIGRKGLRTRSKAAPQPASRSKGQAGSVDRYTYSAAKVNAFWKSLRGSPAKSKTAAAPKPSPLLTPPTFSNAHQVATAKVYFVVVSQEIYKNILDEPLTPESLTAILAGGGELRPTSLTQALQMPWRSDELRRKWQQVWDQAIANTRAKMEQAVAANARDRLSGGLGAAHSSAPPVRRRM